LAVTGNNWSSLSKAFLAKDRLEASTRGALINALGRGATACEWISGVKGSPGE
jgi:hypothetical protein